MDLLEESVQSTLRTLPLTLASTANPMKTVLIQSAVAKTNEIIQRTTAEIQELELSAAAKEQKIEERVKEQIATLKSHVDYLSFSINEWEKSPERSGSGLNELAMTLESRAIGLDRALAEALDTKQLIGTANGVVALGGRYLTDSADRIEADLKNLAIVSKNLIPEVEIRTLFGIVSEDTIKDAEEIWNEIGGQDSKVGEYLAQGLNKESAKEITKLVVGKVAETLGQGIVPAPAEAASLVSQIFDLQNRPPLTSTGFDDRGQTILAYASVAKSIAQTLGDKETASTIGTAIQFAQTGYQIYQAASVLMVASGYGAVIAGMGLLSGAGGLSSLGLGGGGAPDGTPQVLAAIAKLQAYMAEQFAAIKQRLARIENELEKMGVVLNEVQNKLEVIDRYLVGLQTSFSSLRSELSQAVFDITEDDRILETRQLRAIVLADVILPEYEFVKALELSANRISEAFRKSRTLDAKDSSNALQQLGDFLQQLNGNYDPYKQRISADPVGALLKLLKEAEEAWAVLPRANGKIYPLPAPVQPGIISYAISDYCELVESYSRRQPSFFKRSQGKKDLLANHASILLEGYRATNDLSIYLRAPMDINDSWVVSRLFDLMKSTSRQFVKEWHLLEWRLVRDYFLDIANLPDDGQQKAAFARNWGYRLTPKYRNAIQGKNQDVPLAHTVIGRTYDMGINFQLSGLATQAIGAAQDAVDLEIRGDGSTWESPPDQNYIVQDHSFRINVYGVPLDDVKIGPVRVNLGGYVAGTEQPTSTAVVGYGKYDVISRWYVADNATGTPAGSLVVFPSGHPREIVLTALDAYLDRISAELSADKASGAITNLSSAIANEGIRKLSPYLDHLSRSDLREELYAIASRPIPPIWQTEIASLKRLISKYGEYEQIIRAVCAIGMPEFYEGEDVIRAILDSPDKPLSQSPPSVRENALQMRSPTRDLLKALSHGYESVDGLSGPEADSPSNSIDDWKAITQFLTSLGKNKEAFGEDTGLIRDHEPTKSLSLDCWFYAYEKLLGKCLDQMALSCRSMGSPLQLLSAKNRIDDILSVARGYNQSSV